MRADQKRRFGQNLPVLLLISTSGRRGLSQHASGPDAADGYLTIRLPRWVSWREMSSGILPAASGRRATTWTGSLGGAAHDRRAGGPPHPEMPVPPPLRARRQGSLPGSRRERQLAFTEEDRAFLDRTFASIADREEPSCCRIAEAAPDAARRESMGTPEGEDPRSCGDELKLRARRSWPAPQRRSGPIREQELLSAGRTGSPKAERTMGCRAYESHCSRAGDLLRQLRERRPRRR